jgi:hypothetical protein
MTGRRARRPSTMRRQGCGAVAATTLAALLAGCSSSSPASSAGATSGAASGQQASGSASGPASGAASPGRPAANLRELAQRTSAAAKAKSTALVDFTSGSVSTMSGAIRYHGNGADLAVSTNAGGQQVKLVLVNGVAYVATGQKIQGKTWAKISGQGKDPLSRALGPALSTLSTSLDVSKQLAKEPDAKVTSSSNAQLDGIPVTKYTVTMSGSDLVAQLSGLTMTDAQRKQLQAQFAGARGESVLYVDGADLLRRAESKVTGGKVPATASVVSYSHWGEPVDISAPPASDTVDAATLS